MVKLLSLILILKTLFTLLTVTLGGSTIKVDPLGLDIPTPAETKQNVVNQTSQIEATSIQLNTSVLETPTAKVTESPIILENVTATTDPQDTTTIDLIDGNIDLGPCVLGTTSRHTRFAVRSRYETIENVLNCSEIAKVNYRETLENFQHQTRLYLQQIEITNSDPAAIFPAIELICERLDCSKLTVFNISGHQIYEFDKLRFWLSQWTRLEVLDISNTSVTTFNSFLPTDFKTAAPLVYLTSLLVDSNNISELDFNLLVTQMPNLRHLSLINNSILSIDCDETLKSKVQNQLEVIALAGNAINCDKSHLWIMKYFTDSQTNLKFPEHDQIRCTTPERLGEMNWAQRVSVLETPICDECDCRSLKRTAISVDCHNKNLSLLPDVLPLNTKILNFTSNRIMSIGVPQNSKNWENVTYMYLGNNLITSFQPLEINSKFMRNLAALDIRQNKFQEFPSHIFEQFVNLDQVHLSNNPWSCDCESTFAFQEWLQRQFQKVGDKEEIMCGILGTDENGVRSLNLQQRLSGRVIYRLSKSELCPQDSVEEPYEWLDIANMLLGLTIILIITKLALDYLYQYRTKRLPRFFKLNF